MNFLFLSPNYPDFFYKFCAALRQRGVTVLGVGDSPQILPELKNALSEYRAIKSLSDFPALCAVAEEYQRAYGALGGVDSNNEFWMETEAKLRERYGIAGLCGELLGDYKQKSRMKARFQAGGVPVAPWVRSCSREAIAAFASEQGFPLFCKPDNGVGAGGIHKFNDIVSLDVFLSAGNFAGHIFEPYVEGELYSYDGLCDAGGNIVFETCHFFDSPIDQLKETGGECVYRTLPEIPEELTRLGRASVRAFGLKQRFFHIEFFKLTKRIPGIAEAGQFVGLEANMRIAGGYTAEMIYHALGLDLYGLWAAVMAGESPAPESYRHTPGRRTAVNVARKIHRNYRYTIPELAAAYPTEFILAAETEKEENPFGNTEILAAFPEESLLTDFVRMATEKR